MKITNSFLGRSISRQDREKEARNLRLAQDCYAKLEKDPNKAISYFSKFIAGLEDYSVLGYQAFVLQLHAMDSAVIASELKDFNGLERILISCRCNLGEILEAKISLTDLKIIRGLTQRNITSFKLAHQKGHIDRRCWLSLCSFLHEIIDAVDVCENILQGNVVFLDKFLAITWFSSRAELSKNFQVRGETTIAVKTVNNLWTFDKFTDNIRVPVKTLRQAQKACQSWNGSKLFGQITHAESARIASFLGFRLAKDKAFLEPALTKGFKNVCKQQRK